MLQAIRNAARKGLDQTGASSYSNFGLAVLGYALGRATGTPFPELQKVMTDELEMANTWIETLPEGTRVDHLATGYFGPCRADYHYDDGIFLNGAGSTLSSGNDLSRFLEAIMSANSSSSSDSLQQALRLSTTPIHYETETSGIAYSWFFDQYGSSEGTIYQHGGLLFGFHSTAIFQPSTQTAIVGLSNCCGGWIGSGVSLWSAGEALASKLLRISSDGETGRIFKQMREQEAASMSMLFNRVSSLEY